jgi:hypothetical protein
MELAATENSYAFHAPDLPESSADGIQLYKKKKFTREPVSAGDDFNRYM